MTGIYTNTSGSLIPRRKDIMFLLDGVDRSSYPQDAEMNAVLAMPLRSLQALLPQPLFAIQSLHLPIRRPAIDHIMTVNH